MEPLYVITPEQALSQGLGVREITFAARWNETAAKIAQRRKNPTAARRHQRQAEELKAVAKILAG